MARHKRGRLCYAAAAGGAGMGVYTNWVEGLIERELGTPQRSWGFGLLTGLARAWSWLWPRPLELRRTLVVADFEPGRAVLCESLGGLPARVVLPFAARAPIPGVAYGQFETGTNPLAWDPATEAAVPAQVDTVALYQSWSQIHGKT